MHRASIRFLHVYQHYLGRKDAIQLRFKEQSFAYSIVHHVERFVALCFPFASQRAYKNMITACFLHYRRNHLIFQNSTRWI